MNTYRPKPARRECSVCSAPAPTPLPFGWKVEPVHAKNNYQRALKLITMRFTCPACRR